MTEIPDLEKVASAWVRDRLGVRVVGKPPADTAAPWVQVVQLDAGQEPGSRVDHLVSFLVQFDCYAGADGGQPEANGLGRLVRATLQELGGVRDDTVISAVRVVGDARIPDETFEPARERRVLTMAIWAHRAHDAVPA